MDRYAEKRKVEMDESVQVEYEQWIFPMFLFYATEQQLGRKE